MGHEVTIEIGDGDVSTQCAQIGNLVDHECDVIIVWPLDRIYIGHAINELVSAQVRDIPVIAFYNIINNCEAVKYFVGINYRGIGNQQAEYICNALGSNASNVVVIVGPEGSNDVMEIYNGAMETFDNYEIEFLNGTPVILEYRSKDDAYAAMCDLLDDHHGEEIPAICCCIDLYAEGVIQALCEYGYDENNMPIITSFGGSDEAKQNVLNGLQSMTIMVDYSKMVADVVNTVAAILGDEEPEADETVNNGSTNVPTIYVEGWAFTKDNSLEPDDLDYIIIEEPPTKTDYFEYESFNTAGMVVRAYFVDGTSAIVTGYNYSPHVFQRGDNSVTISYTVKDITKTATQPVTVMERELVSISAIAARSYYLQGDTLTKNDFHVTAEYNVGPVVNIFDFDFSPKKLEEVGSQTIYFNYQNKVCSLDITVCPKLTQISIVKKPDKEVYYNNERINRTGMEVKAYYSDGKNYDLSLGSLIISPTYVKFKIGKTDAGIEVSYTEHGVTETATFTVYKQTGAELDNCDITQDMGASGTGSFNLTSGQITYKFEDFVSTDSNMPINIARIYKNESGWENSYIGKHWRLNLQQVITKKSNYIYTDKEGKEYTFVGGYPTEYGRSAIRNEKLGLDLYLYENNGVSQIHLVDRGNNTLVFIKMGTVYRLSSMHQYPSTPDNVINAYSMQLEYADGRISAVTAGSEIDGERPKVIFNYDGNVRLNSIKYKLGSDEVTVVDYTYDNTGALTSIKKQNKNVTESFCAETRFAETESGFTVKDLTSKDIEGNFKSLEYVFKDDGKVTQYSIGYGSSNREFSYVAYTKRIDPDADKVYTDVISSTYLTHKNTISVVSFNSYDTVAQYSYEVSEVIPKYQKPKRVISASSQGFDYKSLADSYSDTLDIYHSNFASGKDDWIGGTIDSAYSINGGAALRGTSLKKSYKFSTLKSGGETLYVSLWAFSDVGFSVKVAISGARGTDEIKRKFNNALNGKWQFTAFPLGRIMNNETITITVTAGGTSIIYIDDVRIIKAPYEVPDDIPKTELNTFGNAEKTYRYNPIDGKIACTEYKYNEGQQLTEEKVTIDNALQSLTEYAYNSNGLLISQKNYGKGKQQYIEQKYGYTGYKRTAYYDENNSETKYSEGREYTRFELIGETNSPTITVKNTYYGIAGFLKEVTSNNCRNEMTYTTDGSVKNAKSGTNINFVYDNFGNVEAVKIGETSLVAYAYDWKHLNSLTYANGTTIGYAYDENDRVISITESGATPVTISYSDNAEDEVTVTNGNGTIYASRTVNKGGVTGEYTVTIPNESRALKVQGCALNGTGNVSTVKTYFGNATDLFESCVTTKDGEGLVTKLERSGHGASVTYSYDGLYRLTTKAAKYSSTKIFTVTYGYNTVSGNRETPSVESETLRVGSTQQDGYRYTYYNNGNLKEIYSGTKLNVRYKYDGNNRLIREDNYTMGYSYEYAYDTDGKITGKKRYKITSGVISGTAEKTDSYTYANSIWKDLLTSYNGSPISYDALGNPLSYLGKTLQWRGRRLIKAGGVEMEYDYNGLRIRKGSRVYYWQGKTLKVECWGNNYIYYYYDESGVSGMNYNGTDYYYRKDILGNIIAIYAGTGVLVAKYEYDAWGNCKILTDTNGIGAINPMRYRSYYYDTEFGLYYLQSRYYDPEVCRFISADDVSYLDPETINGLNLYAYCLNNPVMGTDPDGTFALSTILVAMLVGAIIGAVTSGVKAYDDGLDAGGIALSMLGGAVMGAAVSGAFALGGAAATTGLTILGHAISGTTLFAVASYGTAVAGVINYQLNSMAYGVETTIEGYMDSAFEGFMEGIVSFAAGGLAGANGYYDNIDKSIFKTSKIIETISRSIKFSLPSTLIRGLIKTAI